MAGSGKGAKEAQREAVRNLGPNATKAEIKVARSVARSNNRAEALASVERRAKVYSTTVAPAAGATTTNAVRRGTNKFVNFIYGE